MRMWLWRCIMSASLVIVSPATLANDALSEAVTAIEANVVFMRHANAPGFGDPENFSIADCATQRNLDDVGRNQAESIGRAIRGSSVRFVEILSSEWCRCKDTAQLLKLGAWQTFSGLNSFFQNHADASETLTKLHQRLLALKPGVTLMVTHQVVISAVTGSSVGSGEMVAFNTRTRASRRINVQELAQR